MCGIAGFCLNPKHNSNTTDLAAQMLLDIEHRGYHATGAAWINPTNGKRTVCKAALPASKFITRGAGKTITTGASTAILHTRWATQGSASNNDNNHPVSSGNLVLTHNGHISNDDQLFKQLKVKRVGQVDTEAAAALLAYGKGHPTELLTRLRGTAALAWITQGDSATLHLARVSSSPLWIAQTFRGSLVYGSTEETVDNASVMLDDAIDWKYSAAEGEYFRVVNGKIVEFKQFTPIRDSFSSSWDYRNYSDTKWDMHSGRDTKWDKYYDDEHSMLNF